MQIHSITHIHLDQLYQACVTKQNNQEIPGGTFGNHISILYRQVEITFLIHDVSLYEAFLIKHFATSTTPLVNKRYLKEYTEITGAPKKFTALVNAITHNDKVPNQPIKLDYQYLYGPCYFIHGDMSATFTGIDLTKFFEFDPTKFFVDSSDGRCFVINEGEKIPKLIPDFQFNESSFGKQLITLFTKSFKEFSLRFIEEADILTDVSLHELFSNQDTPVLIRCLKNPFVKVDFKENWKEGLAEPGYLINSSDFKTENFQENTKITFELHTSFIAFLELYDRIPNRFFTYLEDVRGVFYKKDIFIPDIFMDYEKDLSSRYKEMNEYIESLKDKSPLLMYQYTYLNAKYSYNIEVSFYEFNLIFGPLMQRVKFRNETLDILKTMLKYMKSIHNYIF